MVSKDLGNSELNRRISSDLRARTQTSILHDDPDLEDDSAYVENTKQTSRFTWVWLVLIVLAIISLICIVLI